MKKAIDIVTRVGRLLSDISQITWSESTMFPLIDSGQVMLIRRVPFANKTRESVSLVAGYAQKAPDDCVAIIGIPANTGGDAITPIERMLLDVEVPGWVNTPLDVPVIHVMYTGDPKEFLTYPARPTPPGAVDMEYAAYPTAITEVADDLSVLDEFVEPLVYYVAHKLLDANTSEANTAVRAREYSERVEDFIAEITGVPRAVPQQRGVA